MRRAAFHGCLLDINIRYVAFPSSRLFNPCAVAHSWAGAMALRCRDGTRHVLAKRGIETHRLHFCFARVARLDIDSSPSVVGAFACAASDTPHGLRCVPSPRPGELADAHGGTSRHVMFRNITWRDIAWRETFLRGHEDVTRCEIAVTGSCTPLQPLLRDPPPHRAARHNDAPDEPAGRDCCVAPDCLRISPRRQRRRNATDTSDPPDIAGTTPLQPRFSSPRCCHTM